MRSGGAKWRWAFSTLLAMLPASVIHAQTAESRPPDASSYARAADIPVEVFFKRAEFSQMSMSPDGKSLAALSPKGGRDNLVVVDLVARKVTSITNYEKQDVVEFMWISNDRIFFRAATNLDITGARFYRGAYAIDVDGKNFRDLTFPGRKGAPGSGGSLAGFSILSRTNDGTGDVIVAMDGRVRGFPDVYRYNTRTGEHKLLTFDSPGRTIGWVLDRNLAARIAIRAEERKDNDSPRLNTIWHRAGEDSPWEKIGEASSLDNTGSIQPIAFDYDNKTLYVSSNIDRDKRAIFKYDIAGKKLGEMVVQHPLIDLSGGLLFNRSRKALVGIRYDADRPDTAWFDEKFATLQARIDKALPGAHNQFSLADDNVSNVLLFSNSDKDPGTYYILNTESLKLERITNTRSWLPPKLMAERRFIKYKTRDGMEIPAWVTIPHGSSGKNMPLIVNIHGGPHLRSYSWSEWGYWPEAQFFASRGYVVLEPEPRGSRGFGRKHYAASFKQWGLTMQDDITDGAMHLVKEGIVDEKRMCLHGGSYGGYAALQGVVKDPDLWRCASPFVAVSDMFLLFDASSDTRLFSDYLESDARRIIGDPKVDAAQFEKTSPARNASVIKAPILLAMGVDDMRVPLVHGRTMRTALERAGKSVEYVEYPDEGHGFIRRENVIDFYKRLEKFFAQHLKP